MRRAQAGAVKEMRPKLAAAVAAYDSLAEPDTTTRGGAANFRQMKPPSLPGRLDYELLSYAGGVIGVELHLEGDPVAPLRDTIEPMAATLHDRFPTVS